MLLKSIRRDSAGLQRRNDCHLPISGETLPSPHPRTHRGTSPAKSVTVVHSKPMSTMMPMSMAIFGISHTAIPLAATHTRCERCTKPRLRCAKSCWDNTTRAGQWECVFAGILQAVWVLLSGGDLSSPSLRSRAQCCSALMKLRETWILGTRIVFDRVCCTRAIRWVLLLRPRSTKRSNLRTLRVPRSVQTTPDLPHLDDRPQATPCKARLRMYLRASNTSRIRAGNPVPERQSPPEIAASKTTRPQRLERPEYKSSAGRTIQEFAARQVSLYHLVALRRLNLPFGAGWRRLLADPGFKSYRVVEQFNLHGAKCPYTMFYDLKDEVRVFTIWWLIFFALLFNIASLRVSLIMSSLFVRMIYYLKDDSLGPHCLRRTTCFELLFNRYAFYHQFLLLPALRTRHHARLQCRDLPYRPSPARRITMILLLSHFGLHHDLHGLYMPTDYMLGWRDG
ncbi:hypothetical protein CEK25_009366 [Fusarium fujikuroi]|nr:hypothetical protein CEK25_009366 [Fusarium fujikuroi]